MRKVLEEAFQDQGEGELPTDLDELARERARRMLVAALEAEAADSITRPRQRGRGTARRGGGRPYGPR